MAVTPTISFADLKKSIKSPNPAPVYLLHGEECYFIDKAVELFNEIIPEWERDFNMYTLYATQTTPEAVVSTCLRLPVMADRQLVILKEAQNMRKTDLGVMIPYIKQPNPGTVFVIVYRGAKFDGKPLLDAVKSTGIVFESKKITENNIHSHVSSIVKEFGLNIDAKGSAMLTDHLGADLAKLYNEVEKLSMILGKGSTITPESIELNVGISKDYNNFELIDAIAARNFIKAMKIVDYFKKNPKKNSAIPAISIIFNYFANLLMAQFAGTTSSDALMKILGLKWPKQLQPILQGMRNYNAWITIEVIDCIREYDVKCKGVDSRLNEHVLLTELIYRIFCAKGRIKI